MNHREHSQLENAISYSFQEPILLTQALTHPSLSYEKSSERFDNQRLEFLGDAVLQLVLTTELYRLFPTYDEGPLTRLRAKHVSRKALSKYATHLELGSYIYLGKGEELSGGRYRDSTLADAYEALIGAIYLDGGLSAASKFILAQCQNDLNQLLKNPHEEIGNPKGRLQEKVQSMSLHNPEYRIVKDLGPDHDKTFSAEVYWNEEKLGSGKGSSKKLAEIAAARKALQHQRIVGLENGKNAQGGSENNDHNLDTTT